MVNTDQIPFAFLISSFEKGSMLNLLLPLDYWVFATLMNSSSEAGPSRILRLDEMSQAESDTVVAKNMPQSKSTTVTSFNHPVLAPSGSCTPCADFSFVILRLPSFV
jgi:hypothetical protein